MAITVHLNKYSIDTRTPEGTRAYKAIEEKAKALGHTLFDVNATPGRSIDDLPDTMTIETEHLFNNQYNTAEGHRIFDWYEGIIWWGGKRSPYRTGYYLTGDIDKLLEAKRARHVCSYCGAQYDNPDHVFCTKCLGSEYLTEKDLPLLQLKPLAAPIEPPTSGQLEKLKDAWIAEQPKMLARLAQEKTARLLKKAQRLEKDRDKKIADLQHETEIQAKLLRLGIDTDNLIYYSHTKQWVFGWRNKLSISEIDAISKQLSEHRKILGAKWCDNVEFKGLE